MYQAIVFLPLLGAIIAGLVALAGAHARHPGATPKGSAEDHARSHVDESSRGRHTRRPFVSNMPAGID